MKDLKKLSRGEMKKVLGGMNKPCENDCTTDAQCPAANPKCHFSTCEATGKPANICGVA